MKSLEASEVPLVKIFCSDYDFHIPEYQRQYAWDTEQALQLLDDLTGSLDRDTDEPYFLGSIVLVKDKLAPQAEVIDGQQRLTTLTILLAVLRDLTPDATLARELDAMIREPGKIVESLPAKPRLALRPRDSSFFRQFVQEPSNVGRLIGTKPDTLKTDAQKAVRANAAALHSALESWHEQRRLELIRLLGSRTFLVVVSTPDLDSAYRIFSVMNARGLDLAPADIFKSLVIGGLGDGPTQEYADKWENAEQALGRDDFSDLFLHIRMIFAKERARRVLLKEFPEQVLDRYLKGREKEFVDDVLLPYADAYEDIRDQNFASPHGADRVNAWTRRLVQLDNNDWWPAALWALRSHREDPEWLDRFFAKLERLAASMLIRRVYTTPRVTRYAELLTQLDRGDDLESEAFELSDSEKADTIQRLEGDVYLVTKVRKYVLLRLDEILAKDPGATYNHALITVEHVLPQNPDADSEWITRFSKDDRARWTHRLANLVLLNRAKNSEAQNYDFKKKKEMYFTGKNGVAVFALTSQVLNHAAWTPELLEVRQQELIGTLTRGWQLV